MPRFAGSRSILMGCVLLVSGQMATAGRMEAAGAPAAVQSRDLVQAAAAAPVGGALRLENVQVGDTEERAAFVLERFQVFASDAQITLHGEGGQTTVLPAPANAYFRGTVDGETDSKVFLVVLESGTAQGIVTRGEDTYLIGGEDAPAKAAGAPLAMQLADTQSLRTAQGAGFTCGNDALPENPHPVEDLLGGALAGLSEAPEAAPAEVPTTAALPAFTARVAVETDFEFYSKFNNATTATNYVGNLLGYSSGIYVTEINTSMVVQSLSLWTTASDPWQQTSTTCGLMEFGRYWNLNRTNVSRTIAHFMSGKANGGGVAWVGVLCSGGFGASSNCPGLATDAPWGGGYGYTGNMSGQFNIGNPTVMWDIMAVSHEIGHNFNSPHTHCYNGIGGNSNPIDQCYSGECANGCSCAANTLPGPAGVRSGTIMSYCHLLSGGYGNMALNFGTGHPYGVAPGREAVRMTSHVVTTAAGNPTCLALVAGGAGLFNDGFEGGVLPGPWSGTRTP
jgi:Metallo-peptidase family M12